MTEFEETPVEYDKLNLEEQLLDHLATPEGAMAIWKERLSPEVVPDSEADFRDALIFVTSYMDEYRSAPSPAVIAEETRFVEFNEPIAPIEYVLGKLRERHQRRRLFKISDRMTSLAAEPKQGLAFGIDELQKLRLETTSKKGVVTSDDLYETVEEYISRQTEGGVDGVTFGFDDLDQHFGGLRLGELTVLLARPKRYKSWLLLKSAYDALLSGENVAFATMELSEQEMRDRLSCMAAEVSYGKYKSNTLRQEDLLAMQEAAQVHAEQEAKLHFFRPRAQDRVPAYLASYALDQGATVLYIDQLSWFEGARNENAHQKIGGIMEELKDAAQEFPIFMAAQYNRQVTDIDSAGDLANIGLADAIGQTADNLLGIWASKDMMRSTPRIIHLTVVDSRTREGETWEIKVDLNQNSNFKCLGTVEDNS